MLRLPVPLPSAARAVLEAESSAEEEGDTVPEMVPELVMLGEAEVSELALLLQEPPAAVAEPQGLAVPLTDTSASVPEELGEAELTMEAEPHTDTLLVAEAERLPVALTVSLAVKEALPEVDRDSVEVPQKEAEPEVERVPVRVGDPEPVRVTEGRPLLLPLLQKEPERVLTPLEDTVTERLLVTLTVGQPELVKLPEVELLGDMV